MRIPFRRTASRTDRRVRALYAEEARRALLLSAVLRFLVIMTMIVIDYEPEAPPETIRLDLVTGLAFAPVGVLQLLMVWRRLDWAWPKYVFILADVVVLTTVALAMAPGDPTLEHPAMLSREAAVVYSFVLLLVSILYLSPAAILWFATCSCVGWVVVIAVLAQLPGVVTEDDVPAGLDPRGEQAFRLQPRFLEMDRWGEEVVVLLIVAVGTAFVVARMRGVALRAARVERQRGNLARYFSPNVIDVLAQRDAVLGEGRQREAAILFADLRDYSALTEDLPPAEVFELLRDVHGALEEQVFAYGGTLEKYIGDAVMVTFGTPVPGAYDASHALCCAWAMLAALDAVNGRRGAEGRRPVGMGIGLHFGEVASGDVGNQRNMAFVTVGAAVNLASRVQDLTRDLGCDVVLTEAIGHRVRREAPAAAEALLAAFSEHHAARVKGFAQSIRIRHGNTPSHPR